MKLYSLFQSELETHGEVELVMDSGETVEAHLGNVTLDEPEVGLFHVDARTVGEERYYDGAKIEQVRLHYDV